MSEIVGNESIDDRARQAVSQLRLAVAARPLPELREQVRRRRIVLPVVAALTAIAVVVGLVVIATNRNHRSVGGGAGFRWIATDLPADWAARNAFDPYGPNDRRPPAPLDNVYATDSAPAGAVLVVTGSAPAPGETGSNEANARESTIDGRRAVFADGNDGQRIVYIELPGSWTRLMSRHIDDSALTRLAQSAVRSDDGSARIPTAQLSDGLHQVASPGTFYDPTLAARVDGTVSTYVAGTDETRQLSLSVGPAAAGTRAGVALRSDSRPLNVGASTGYLGSFSAGGGAPAVFRTLYWERDGVSFYLLGLGLTDDEMLAAATSIRPATDVEWAALINALPPA